jgi:hypothetical protein
MMSMDLDVHKETIRVALAEGGVRGEVGRIAHAAAVLKHLVSKLASVCSNAGDSVFSAYVAACVFGLGP